MHIGDLEVTDLCRDANLFTFTTPTNENITTSLYNDDIEDYHDEKPLILLNNEYEYQDNDMTNLLRNCEEIISKGTTDSHTSNINEDDIDTKNDIDDVGFIAWSVKKQPNIPGMANTCALDTILFLINQMRKNWIYINDEINSSTNSLKYAMELMDINDHDMSRYILTKANTNFCHINNDDDFFDLDSSVGD